MSTEIKLRRDTYANWTSVNPTLAEGEIGLVTNFADNNTRIKIGDGVTAWEDLDYFTTSQDLSNYVTDAELASALSNYVPTSRTVNGKALSSNISIDKTDVGLGSVDNTSDANKPISTATQTALDLKQDKAVVVSSNQTAVNDGVYHNVASATYTDPSPSEGKGFTVFVINGTATVGGTGYSTAGTKIIRRYHSGSWANLVYTTGSAFDPTTAQIGDITATNTTIADNDTITTFASKTQGQINEINDLIGRGYVSPKLYRWFLSFITSPTTSKIAFVGDSTSDFSGNASSIPTLLTNLYTSSGDLLSGINVGSNVLNFGSNGNTIQSFNNNPSALKGFNAVVAANPNLIIFSYGINDIRQNQLTKDQLKAQIITSISALRTALPNCDFVLRMPNSFLIPTDETYIKQGSYPSLAAAAQGQTDILYNAYRELEDYWDNVTLFNSQELIFGRVSLASSNQMTDVIHPVYTRIVEEIVNIVGYKAPFSKGLSLDAINKSYTTPWTHYNRVFENTDYFELVATGRLSAITSTRVDVTCNANEVSSLLHGRICIVIGDIFLDQLPTTGVTITVVSATLLRISYTLPSNSITGGVVNFYRHKFNFNTASEPYVNNRQLYPYRRCLYISSAGSGYIDVGLINYNRLNSYLKDPSIDSAWLLRLLSSNTLIFSDGTTLALSGATSLSAQNDISIRILISGSYSAYANTLVFVFGSQGYELNSSTIQGVYNYPSANVTQQTGFGGLKNGFFKFRGTQGESAVTAEIYKNVSPVAGDTISNTVTKTYFASFFNLSANSLSTGEWIDIEGWYLLSGAASPGNITFYVDMDGTTDTIVLQSSAITIPNSASSQLIRLQGKIFIKTNGSNGVVSGQGLITYPENTTQLYVLKRTTDINPYNTTQALGIKVGVQFSVADVANTITQTAIRIQSVKP